jgi:glycosyltransferase involved in cell wall biosynthesis
MSEPLVSIIIPAYNYAHFITETLENILEQTYTNWECIVVDDGSTDNTSEVVKLFIDSHPHYNFQYCKISNGGIAVARTAGIDRSKGKYLQFLDADDLLSADKLKVQVNHLEKHKVALVYSSSRFFRIVNGVQVLEQRYPDGFLSHESLNGYQLFQKLIEHNIFTVCSAMIRVDLFREVGGFAKVILNNEDWMLWFKMALTQPAFGFDNDISSYVLIRLHGSSVMTQHGIMFRSEVQVREEMTKLLLDTDMDGKAALIKRNKDLLALHQVRSMEISKGMSHIIRSFIKHPFTDYRLLFMGCFKLGVRAYKTLLH